MSSIGKSHDDAYHTMLAMFQQEEAENASDQVQQEELGMQPYFD
jgi:hypothetical protein